MEPEEANDQKIRDTVEMLLDYRRRAAAGQTTSSHDIMKAALATAYVTRGLMTWVARGLGYFVSPEKYRELTLEEKWSLIIEAQKMALPIFQPELRTELSEAIAALNIGFTTPLLEKRRTGRRRAMPHVVARTQLELLCWIRWQHGLGRKVGNAETEVAAAVHLTVTALAKWRVELIGLYGQETVQKHLALAEEVGRWEAATGEKEPAPWTENAPLMFPLPLIDGLDTSSPSSNEFTLLRVSSACLRRDLAAIVVDLQAAMQKRRPPK